MASSSGASEAVTAAPQREFNISLKDKGLWALVGLMVIIASIAQFIGPLNIPFGNASIMLLPMIWALLMGVLISGQRFRPLSVDLQHTANAIMSVAVLVLCGRLSLTLGQQIPALISAGPALLLQELGNVFGSLLLALPLAVLLRMGPATVGATFSIDREPSFAMVTSRFGSDSPQYRGVLSMYVFGSIFGAIIVSLVASVISSLGIFRWEALAMGSGVGSGSMMAAGIASVSAAHPENADTIAAYATTANLIASLAGVPLALWISLPLADRFYKFLTRRQKETGNSEVAGKISALAKVLDVPKVNLHPGASLLIMSIGGLVTASIVKKGFSFDMVLTYALMSAMVALGLWLASVTKGKVPALIVVIVVGAYITSPYFPGAERVLATAASVDFLSVITLMLAIAGLSIGKDLPMLRQIGWKILPVGFVVIGATFLASTVIAEVVLAILHR
ncbi:MAG: DUF3100 domain-containing protein [Propioniciclava sp.]|uniref:DUF3100 domain-containing protein n=1 Tax=Propioniciclava sp. TaxID=2038686 RepID=UPI0039E4A5FA